VKKAVVLLSGGLDSAVTLYLAKRNGYRCFCLSFCYGQRHSREVDQAKKIAKRAGADWQKIKFDLPWKGSSLLDFRKGLPKGVANRKEIPSTYVPARNTIFLSLALSFAEAIGAQAIFIGANAVDFSGYPDCRPQFYRAFGKVISTGTKAGLGKRSPKIKVPLIRKSKAQIIKTGLRLGVPFEITWSCYRGGKKPCGTCDSCVLREKGFKEAGVNDPLWPK
jgi:7-cyano-7-deazaguanine synthase